MDFNPFSLLSPFFSNSSIFSTLYFCFVFHSLAFYPFDKFKKAKQYRVPLTMWLTFKLCRIGQRLIVSVNKSHTPYDVYTNDAYYKWWNPLNIRCYFIDCFSSVCIVLHCNVPRYFSVGSNRYGIMCSDFYCSLSTA